MKKRGRVGGREEGKEGGRGKREGYIIMYMHMCPQCTTLRN